jgi:uncharacterized membrane protein YbhN (UPF0104 family)
VTNVSPDDPRRAGPRRVAARARRPARLAATLGGALLCFAGGLGILAAFAGWDSVASRVRPSLSLWLLLALAFEVVSFAGYVFAYRAVARVAGGVSMSRRRAIRLVAVGFGAFLAKGGGALDAEALREEDDDERVGEVRVLALDVLEHAPLAPAAWIAAIALLIQGARTPGLDFTIPWALLVPVGAVGALVGVRHRDRFEGRDGWRGWLGRVLGGIALLLRLVREWRTHWQAFAGSALYWAGDVLCLWACLRPLGAAPAFAGLVIAHAEGYVLTRRTLPLAGAGVVEIALTLTVTACGAPFADAIVGVALYRVINLWLPLVPAFAALSRS